MVEQVFFKTTVLNYAEGSHHWEKSTNGQDLFLSLIDIKCNFLFQKIAKKLVTLAIGEFSFLFILTAPDIESFSEERNAVEEGKS